MRRVFAGAVFSAALICSAQASVIPLGEVNLTGQGLGVTDPLLTLQATGGATTESGELAALSGPTFGQLGWTSAGDIRLLFNATEPQTDTGKSITIDSIGLTFQSGTSSLTLTNADPIVFPETNPGVGNAGFGLGLDGEQTSQLATFLALIGNISGVSLGISAALSGVAGGPETFSALSSVPLPAAAWLFLSALVGLGILGRPKARVQMAT